MLPNTYPSSLPRKILSRPTLLYALVITLTAILHLRTGEWCTPGNVGEVATHVGSEVLHGGGSLDEKTCRARFPGAFRDVDDGVARGEFLLEKTESGYRGLVQGRIKNNNLYILSIAPDTTPQILHQRTAILSQIHRALITSPKPLPDTYFAFCINDAPKNNSWAFSKPNKLSTYNTWLMPAFSSWAWPSAQIGVMDDVLERIDAVEEEVSWSEKVDKVIWRGTPWFNPLGHPNLRKDLLRVSKGKDWADIQALNSSNGLLIEDFCRYKYIVYTEGVTYSGRLPYHQACESVLIMAPVTWATTSSLVIRPVGAEALMEMVGKGQAGRKEEGARSGALVTTVGDWRTANAVYVEPTFSNLERLIAFLDAHPHVARRIARNQRETVVGGGYLSLATETCYWRALIRGWSKVAIVDEKEWAGLGDGERYESWLLKEVSTKRDGVREKNINTG